MSQQIYYLYCLLCICCLRTERGLPKTLFVCEIKTYKGKWTYLKRKKQNENLGHLTQSSRLLHHTPAFLT